MITVFRKTATDFDSQPSTEKLIFRSSNAADDTPLTLSFAGVVSAAADTEVLTLTGIQEVQTTKTFTSLSSAVLSAACAGTVSVYGQGTKGDGRLIAGSNPTAGNTITLALTSSPTTEPVYEWVASSPTGDQVLIGASATDSMTNLAAAITANHPFLTATSSGTIVTVLDRLACRRSLTWSFTQGGGSTAFTSLSAPVNGKDGELIVSFVAGDLYKLVATSLDDEGLTNDLLPAYATFVSDWQRVSGRRNAIYLAVEDIGAMGGVPLTGSYEVALTSSYPIPGDEALPTLDDMRLVVTPTEGAIELMRLILENSNASGISVSAKWVA